ncbi:protein DETOXIFICATION 44, chloroplastic isoform X2 [Populus trichocarpa]|uniref:protein DETOXIFICATION 44, chloroplastic isoform X2 n=1 Tax=Populus trichocarpa TaxID=3694 RepID=UPI000D18A542|nr:protein DETOXIFICATION 44, chloroplastic isoform X2 [Populus trichocarpa]|eukprot:XP_024443490.1 protein DETOXIFICATION 44, chloroplastic isoform X2 [Populus trichocarpa]
MEAINKLLASSLSSSRFLLSFPTKIQNTQTERERKKKKSNKMATVALSLKLLSIHNFHTNPSFISQKRNENLSAPLKTTVPRSSPPQNNSATTNTNTTTTKTTKTTSLDNNTPNEPKLKPTSVDSKPSSTSTSSLTDSVAILFTRLRDGVKIDEVGVEILSIALPAALALAADPIASLVDTAYVGHIGSVELAAVGVSISIFNLVSKLFNVPLLNITTSFVAEEQALISKNSVKDQEGKRVLPSVSTSLALAAAVGVAETVALSVGSGFLMNIMGIPVDSPMRVPAEQFLTLRAFGAPPIVIALAAQGTFRGFMDTKTPLYAIGAGNLLNAILDAIFIVVFGFGVGGAAVATVISEYLIAFILLWELNDKVQLISPNIDAREVVRYLNSGGLLIGRTIAVLLTMTLATSMAAREGPIQMAGHQICMQVWLAVSLLNDALAIAGQALLASGYSQGNYEQARLVIYRVLQIGLVTGIALGVILSLGFGAFSSLFSTDPEVLGVVWSGIWFVAGSQPMNALAFVLDGLYYGVSDFGFAAYSMVLVSLISSVFVLVAAPVFGLTGVWAGLFLFMTLRVVAGVWRLGTKRGPWEMVWVNSQQESE